jgi:hypothetical protein
MGLSDHKSLVRSAGAHQPLLIGNALLKLLPAMMAQE